jgi:hypothetical protein
VFVVPLPAPPPPDPAPPLAPAGLPARLPMRIWVATTVAFLVAYGFLFTVVHPLVDTRRCVARLPDPLFAVLPYAHGWYLVSHELFYLVTVVSLSALVALAARGDHRPLVRFALGISLQAALRSITLALLPICRATVEPGHAALDHLPTVDLGFARVPWRTWATNDLVFSGHVAEFLILSFAVWGVWPRRARVALVAFQLLQTVALIATRGHYTVDIVIAVPFAFFADRVTVGGLTWWARRRTAAALSG